MTESNDIQVKEQLNIRLVLDRSGSMSSCKEETVVSINEYINEIQKEAVEGVFTLSTFDNRSIDIPISRIPIRELTTLGEDILMPRGGTPLYDAIGTAVHDLSTFTHTENEKKVLVIVTDGYENASREYTSDAIKQLIEEKTKEEATRLGSSSRGGSSQWVSVIMILNLIKCNFSKIFVICWKRSLNVA